MKVAEGGKHGNSIQVDQVSGSVWPNHFEVERKFVNLLTGETLSLGQPLP